MNVQEPILRRSKIVSLLGLLLNAAGTEPPPAQAADADKQTEPIQTPPPPLHRRSDRLLLDKKLLPRANGL